MNPTAAVIRTCGPATEAYRAEETEYCKEEIPRLTKSENHATPEKANPAATDFAVFSKLIHRHFAAAVVAELSGLAAVKDQK